MDFAGFAAPFVIYAALLLLHLIVPARRVAGYVRDEQGRPLQYRLNGLAVLAIALATWWALAHFDILRADWLWSHRWASLAGACAIGVGFTGWIVGRAPAGERSLGAEVFFGRLENPQFLGGRVDAKMFLYLVGAVMLALNVASFAAHHYLAHPVDPSPGVLIHALLLGFFLSEYLFFERVHLYTYDFFAERVGFKLGWGCLTFYPYFYGVGLWALADQPNPQAPAWLGGLAVAIFFIGWSFARGANMQKFHFKLDPTRSFLGIRPQVIAEGDRRLLCSGFWGLARHINYLGEILMATGLALALGQPTSPWPWLYPLYYVVLLLPRERDDDRRCAAKYGELWNEYRRRVPWRIVPGIY